MQLNIKISACKSKNAKIPKKFKLCNLKSKKNIFKNPKILIHISRLIIAVYSYFLNVFKCV
jgi:hypothetical protein